jgi:hypothetical protein
MGLSGGGSDVEFGEQAPDPFFNVVADGPLHRVDVLAGGVGDGPFFVAFSGEDGAGVPAAHGDDDSAAWTISSVQRLGNSLVMSMPTSAMAWTAAGLISLPGSDPPDQAIAWSPARWVKKPSAIWERPALWMRTNNTVGLASVILTSTRARAVRRWRAKRSASSGRKLGTEARPANWS